MLFELFRFRVPRVGKFRTSVTTSGWGTPTHRTSANALTPVKLFRNKIIMLFEPRV